MKVAITGGGGYVGFHVGWAIAQGGHEVILVDLVRPDQEWHELAPKALYDALPTDFWDKEGKGSNASLQFVKANVTDYSALKTIFQGATAVIHTASYGISGREQLSAHMNQIEEVNITGTRTVIAAATDAKVQALVYTSTYNVVFGGQEIIDGDESLPYFPLHKHSDHYSRTKTIAEMLVLTVNGKSLLNFEDTLSSQSAQALTYESPQLLSLISQPSVLGHKNQPENLLGTGKVPSKKHPSTLHTCALRLAGVMGLGERRHSCRVIDALRAGFLCTFGKKENLVDFIGIQNVVQAHIKAMMALIKEEINTSGETLEIHDGGSESNGKILQSLSGKAFFISDGIPKNHFEYFRPWYEGLGYGFPTIRLPLALILVIAHMQQMIYQVVHKIFPFKPFITPAEVYKSGVTHYFSCRKATNYFSYAPTRPNDHTQMVEYQKRRGSKKDSTTKTVVGMPFMLIILAISFFSILYLTFI